MVCQMLLTQIVNKMKKIKEYWWWLCPIGLVIYYLIIVPQSEADLERYGKEAIATVTQVRSKTIRFEFLANNEPFSDASSKGDFPSVMTNYLISGEKYFIFYDSINPYNNILYMDKPIFDTALFSRTRVARLEEISEGLVEFEYGVGDKIYSRYQVASLENEVRHHSLAVWYYPNNPRMAYLVGL
jgi:hypothetical protein